jgi:hypothetical protein
LTLYKWLLVLYLPSDSNGISKYYRIVSHWPQVSR